MKQKKYFKRYEITPNYQRMAADYATIVGRDQALIDFAMAGLCMETASLLASGGYGRPIGLKMSKIIQGLYDDAQGK